jgi:hypothetical protein
VGILKDKELLHPADTLAIALDRVAGLLGVLTGLYNGSANSFSGGNSFVEHAISTASGLVDDAQAALSDLHYSCDLTMLEQPAQRPSVLQDVVVPEPAEDVPEAEMRFDRMQAASVVQESAVIVVPPVQESREQVQFAKSYLELLKKLTAAEVFASEQQALSAPGSATELLPLLRGLREEFQKMHNVA